MIDIGHQVVQVVNRDDDGGYAEGEIRCGAEFPDDHETRMWAQGVENLELVPPVLRSGLYHGFEGRRYADAHIVLTGDYMASAAMLDGDICAFFGIAGMARGKASEQEHNCQGDTEHQII